MEIHHHQQQQQQQKNIEKQLQNQIEGGGAEYLRQLEAKEGRTTTKQASPTTSPTTSPSHEFSFTISLHSSSSSNTTIPADKSKAAPPPSSSLAIDLSPADDIFFHGHLLPLHLLSHLPSSPRFSTNSINSFRGDLLEDHEIPLKESGSCGASNRSNITMDRIIGNNNNSIEDNMNRGTMTSKGGEERKTKANTFSLFGSTRGRKGICPEEKEKQQKRKVIGYDVIHAVKRYLRSMVLFRGRRSEKDGLNNHGGQAYSSRSGNLIRKKKPELMRGRRGEFSAPASMRTSPTNSGVLLSTKTLPPPPPPGHSDSTMEELHAAIQAAIAHCKNSIAKEDKLSLNC